MEDDNSFKCYLTRIPSMEVIERQIDLNDKESTDYRLVHGD
jgi:hypothetical protein